MAANLTELAVAIAALSPLSEQLSEPPPSPMSNLLMDIILNEILPRLPAKSLLRFKSVSKSFNRVISSPEFTRLHLRYSLSSEDRLLITNSTDHTIDIYDLNSLSCAPSIPSSTFCWPIYNVYTVYLLGSCNGLLLISVSRFLDNCLPLVLLNPSTRTYINFQSTSKAVIEGTVGFGFDDHTNDYKIVAVSNMHTNHKGKIVDMRVTTVYSVNSKSWKVVDQTLCSDSIEERVNGVLINNNLLHWMLWTDFSIPSKRKLRIGCFDVITEKWRDDVLLPDCHYNPCRKSYFLDFGVLDGWLFSSYLDQVNWCFEVWVLKEYSVHDSWMTLFKINLLDDPDGGVSPIAKLFNESTLVEELDFLTAIERRNGVVPIACLGAGQIEVLLRERFGSKHFWYNRKDNTINTAEVPTACSSSQSYICKGSLVKLPDTKLFSTLYKPGKFD